MPTITKLLAVEGYAVDEHGFLYKMQAGGVAKPLRPKTSRFGANRCWFEIKSNGNRIQFYQEDLKNMQGNAIGRIVG